MKNTSLPLRPGLRQLSAEIAKRTGGKLLGEMTADELQAVFGPCPIRFRGDRVTDDDDLVRKRRPLNAVVGDA